MKLSTFGMLFLISIVPSVGVAADGKMYGQYFCYAEHIAGIVHDGQQYSGKVQLRDDEMKFFLTLKPIAPPPPHGSNAINQEAARAFFNYSLCKGTVDYYMKLLENGKSPSEGNIGSGSPDSPVGFRSMVGQCFATDRLTVQYPKTLFSESKSDTAIEYFSYGENPQGNQYLLAQKDELPVADRARIGDIGIADLNDREGNVEPKVPGFVLNKRHAREQVGIAGLEAGAVCLSRRPPEKLRHGENRKDYG